MQSSAPATTASLPTLPSDLANICVPSWIRCDADATGSAAPPQSSCQRRVYASVSASRHASAHRFITYCDAGASVAHGSEKTTNSQPSGASCGAACSGAVTQSCSMS